MPTGNRIRANNIYGIISDNPLTIASSNFNSNSLPLLPVVASAHAMVVLDPQRVYGDPEIIVVTTHTTAATVATVLRGQYGTLAREHPQGTVWTHAPIDEDFTEIVTSTTRPSNPYSGQMIYETDTVGYKFWNGSAWTPVVPLPAWLDRKTYIIEGTGATNGTITSSSFADYPGPISGSFTKTRSDTDIIVQGFIGAMKITGVGSVIIGLRINSVDYSLGAFSWNVVGFLGQHMQINFCRSLNDIADEWAIARVPTGTYTATVRWATSTSGAQVDSNDRVQITIREELGIA